MAHLAMLGLSVIAVVGAFLAIRVEDDESTEPESGDVDGIPWFESTEEPTPTQREEERGVQENSRENER